MAEIELERFNSLTAVAQGRDIRDLVNKQAGWLRTVQPGTVTRYANLLKSAHNVSRLAHSSALEAHIIHKDKVAIGLSTIIFNQRVMHPTEGLLEGDDVDYWINLDEGQPVHDEVARLLINRSARTHGHKIGSLLLESREIPSPCRSIASVIDHHPNPAKGFSTHMQAVGAPAVLSTDVPNDPFDMARNGAIAQLYVREFDI